MVKGFNRGCKQLGCPTANIRNIDHLDLPTGIYCGLAQLVIRNQNEIQQEPGQESAYQDMLKKLPYISPIKGMVCSFGYNPHYANSFKTLEVHILDKLDFDFYGSELRVILCKKMRDEEKYNSVEELKVAIANDIRNANNEVPNFQKHVTNRDYFLDCSIQQAC